MPHCRTCLPRSFTLCSDICLQSQQASSLQASERQSGLGRLLYGEGESTITARAIEIERLRSAYQSSLLGKVRMAAKQAKQEKSLQALQGALTRPELSSQARAHFCLANFSPFSALTKAYSKCCLQMLWTPVKLVFEQLMQL